MVRKLATIVLISLVSSRTFAASAAGMGTHVCDPNYPVLPGVLLIGEEHDVPSSIGVRFKIAEAAAMGEYPAAIEPMGRRNGSRMTITGSFLPKNEAGVTERFGGRVGRSLLTGLESPVPYAVFFSYFFRIDQMNRRLPAFVSAMNIIDFAHDLPVFAKALEAMMDRASTSARLRELLPLTTQLNALRRDAAYQRLDDQAKIEVFHDRFSPRFSLEDLDRFASAHHAEVVRLANAVHRDVFGPKPLPVLETVRDRELFGCTGTPCAPTGRLRRLFIDHRDRDFARRVNALLCAHAGRWSHVVVDVGHAHVAGLSAELARLTKGRARIETYRSDRPADASKITAALARVRPLRTLASTRVSPRPAFVP